MVASMVYHQEPLGEKRSHAPVNVQALFVFRWVFFVKWRCGSLCQNSSWHAVNMKYNFF